MKLNSTVALSLILLTLMAGAGYMSGVLGFTVGSEALKGVTQPDTRPTTKVKVRQGASQQRAVVMLKEEDILTNVRARIEGKGKNPKPEKPQSQSKTVNTQASTPQAQLVANEIQPGFPIANQNQGVMLEVISARYSGGTLQLKLNLKNEGDKTVRFLYSFMNVTDDRGRTLSAMPEGLPDKLPPDGKTMTGTLSIPTTMLDDVQKLSLSLTDYPEQQLKLQVAEIPVKI